LTHKADANISAPRSCGAIS